MRVCSIIVISSQPPGTFLFQPPRAHQSREDSLDFEALQQFQQSEQAWLAHSKNKVTLGALRALGGKELERCFDEFYISRTIRILITSRLSGVARKPAAARTPGTHTIAAGVAMIGH